MTDTDTNAPCTPSEPAQTKPCCKCEAYREIQLESAAEIARLMKLLEQVELYAGYAVNDAKKRDKP